jgi:hypothetical protein
MNEENKSQLEEDAALEEMFDEVANGELLDDGADLIASADKQEMIPQMHVSVPEDQKPESFVTDVMLDNLFTELLNQGRQDRVEISDLLNNVVEMVINSGDGSSASKEAMVNLVKAKSDVTDKMVKVADLMTRIKLRDRDTFRPYLNAKQENNYNFDSADKKALIS